MATYAELLSIAGGAQSLKDKIRVACVIAAEQIRTEDVGVANHANRLVWAKSVFENPSVQVERMLWAVLAQNKTLTTAQITGASDAAVQSAVDSAVNVFAT